MKRTILIFADYYLPGYLAGGPIQSISNMVNWLGDEFKFKIITSNTDYTKSKPYKEVETNNWNRVGKADVFYFDGSYKNYQIVLKEIKKLNADLVYFNSFFSLKFTIIPFCLLIYRRIVAHSQVVIASRGEFSENALQIKQKKKSVYLFLIKKLKLFHNVNWCFTNEKEKAEFFQNIQIPYREIHLLPNLPKRIDKKINLATNKKPNAIKIVYLSRIASIKNLDYALKILLSITNIEVEFDIYGIKDDLKYWEKCKEHIANFPDNIKVTYKGHVPNKRVPEILSIYHLFFLPTQSENFGHAIYEAMLSGTPVLISDRTPWRNLEAKNLGWDISLDNKSKFIQSIEKIASMNNDEIHACKKKVFSAIQKLEVEESVHENLRVLKKLLH